MALRTTSRNRVYVSLTLIGCHPAASSSLQLPRRLAQMVIAAESPPVMARCTPDEKSGSMKHTASPAMRAYGHAYSAALYDQSAADLIPNDASSSASRSSAAIPGVSCKHAR
ncbi:hypothetical protein BJX64DRAFT_267715 [Aspergillus heterothallicus]